MVGISISSKPMWDHVWCRVWCYLRDEIVTRQLFCYLHSRDCGRMVCTNECVGIYSVLVCCILPWRSVSWYNLDTIRWIVVINASWYVFRWSCFRQVLKAWWAWVGSFKWGSRVDWLRPCYWRIRAIVRYPSIRSIWSWGMSSLP